jgi:hypothetical protein
LRQVPLQAVVPVAHEPSPATATMPPVLVPPVALAVPPFVPPVGVVVVLPPVAALVVPPVATVVMPPETLTPPVLVDVAPP